MLVFKKEKQVRSLVLGHLVEVNECLMEARHCLEEYLAGNGDLARQSATRVVEIESQADDFERKIRETLIDGAFLPNIRSDVYRLVEAVDSIAGSGEDVARMLLDQSPLIPGEYESELLELFGQTLNCFAELRKALKHFFNPKGMIESLHGHVAQVCDIETEVDRLQSSLTRKVFASDLEHSQKLHLSELITLIGTIADLSEDASDELEFAAMKSVV